MLICIKFLEFLKKKFFYIFELTRLCLCAVVGNTNQQTWSQVYWLQACWEAPFVSNHSVVSVMYPLTWKFPCKFMCMTGNHQAVNQPYIYYMHVGSWLSNRIVNISNWNESHSISEAPKKMLYLSCFKGGTPLAQPSVVHLDGSWL